MRREISIDIKDDELFKQQLYAVVADEKYGIVLDSNNYYQQNHSPFNYHRYEFVAAWGRDCACISSFAQLRMFEQKDWLFGGLGYDLKNDFEKLSSNNYDGLQMDECQFFCPSIVVILKGGEWTLEYLSESHEEEELVTWIHSLHNTQKAEEKHLPCEVNIQDRVSKSDYINNVKHLLEHIHLGDIFEINYCIEFFSESVDLDPIAVYSQLKKISPTPFASFYKMDDKYLLCASPERYLYKSGNSIVSQPIKGTVARNSNQQEDIENAQFLSKDLKERSENIMITDLVRNDLSRVAKRSSVKVEELCGIYPFKQVFQMISTISAELSDDFDWKNAIESTFPMGSMTGAPKVRAMQLIEEVETTKRGLYSGAVGYVMPNGDFDFNVVIRSLQYNKTNKYLSYMVGSAITSMSDPEKEYDECLLKASAIRNVLSSESYD